MLSRIRNRRDTATKNEDEDDTKEFLLSHKVTVKEGLSIEKEYKVFEFLGSGKFGDVNRCQEIATGRELAAKSILYNCPDEKEAVMNEVEIMCKLRHPRLIQLYDVFVQHDRITLVMELITGGELFERVIDDNFELDEAICEKFMRQILQGVEYIHSQHVIHLDLKPENILCLSKTGFRIKIIDFGLAREVTNGDLRVMFGTPEFVAPEIIAFDPVTYATDMWSVGVVCYVLLSGLSPFMGDNESETLSNIMRCSYTFDYPEFKDISADAKDFIKSLLHKNPRKRSSATQCLSHPWLREKQRLKRTATVNKKRLRHFVFRRKWQKAVNAIIALQRMGVVLSHNPNKEPEYRKLLQAKSTKTAALFRKSSIRETPSTKLLDSEIKQNRSFSSGGENTKQTAKLKMLIPSGDTQKASSIKKPPQVMVTNPTKPDLNQSINMASKNHISANSSVDKPPTPGQTKVDPKPPFAPQKAQNNNSVQGPSSDKSEVKSSTGANKNRVPSKSPSRVEAEFKSGENKVAINITAENTSARRTKESIVSVETKPDTQVKTTTSNALRPLKDPTQIDPAKNTSTVSTKDSKSPPTEKQIRSLQNQMASSFPPKPDTQTKSNSNNAIRPSTAPSQTSTSQSTTNKSLAPTPSRTDPGRSSVQPVLLKMVSLSKARGSVADRISFFNSSPDSQMKSAKNKKFSLYS